MEIFQLGYVYINGKQYYIKIYILSHLRTGHKTAFSYKANVGISHAFLHTNVCSPYIKGANPAASKSYKSQPYVRIHWNTLA